MKSSYWYRLEGIFSFFLFGPSGPHDFPGKISKIIRPGGFYPIQIRGGTRYWYTIFSASLGSGRRSP